MYQKDQGSRGKYRFNMAVLIMLIFAVMAAGGVWMLTRATADTAVQNVQKVIYVTVDGGTSTKDGKSWETAYSSADLQTAITQSAASKDEAVEVWVKKGVYTRTATLSLDKGAKLYGGFAGNETTEASRDARDIANNKTTLKALEESDGQYEKFSVVTGGNGATSDDTRIDGFIISRGQGNYADDDRYTARGGGMYNNNSSPTITNCTFDSNVIGLTSNNSPTTKCYSYGGAMYNENSSPIVTNCTFENNTARGGGANGTGMRGSDGDGYGGAMYNSGGNPTVTNCTFDTNTARWCRHKEYGIIAIISF